MIACQRLCEDLSASRNYVPLLKVTSPTYILCRERLISTKPEDLEPAIRSLSGDIEQRLEAWMAMPNLAERSYHAQEMTAAAGSLGYMVRALSVGFVAVEGCLLSGRWFICSRGGPRRGVQQRGRWDSC